MGRVRAGRESLCTATPGAETNVNATTPPAAAAPSRSLRLLIVDDDAAVMEPMRIALDRDGHKVTAAEGGQAGIDAFHEAQRINQPYDVVITDLGMPYVDGRQVIESVRAASADTRIILLTGWGQNFAGSEDQALPVDRLLSKPTRLRELRAVLAELTEATS